jgi:sporulation protein YlmC with PRC-barrel domain
MASAIEDVSSLPGESVSDQEGQEIGKVKEVYKVKDGDSPMWVTIESSLGVGETRSVFVPLARMKEEDGNIRVPYSIQRIQDAPEVEVQDELSEEDDRLLRDFYAIDLADQELRSDNQQTYAKQVPEEEGGGAQKATDEVESEPSGSESSGSGSSGSGSSGSGSSREEGAESS